MQGAIGEAGNLYLIPEGAYFHPFYNDINGGTDKLLTASLKAGVLQSVWSPSLSLEVIAFWRLLTPSVKAAFLEPDLPKPVGRYADWMELKLGVSQTFDMGDFSIKHQPTLGFNHVGNKGGRKVHRWVHQVTHNTLQYLEYTDQPEGAFLAYGYEVAAFENLVTSGHMRLDHQLALEANQSRAMTEGGVRYNLIGVLRKPWWEMGLELRMLHQTKSEFYDDIRPYRFEAAIGTLLYRYFTPTVKYVSPYLNGDSIGQTYFDALHFNYPF